MTDIFCKFFMSPGITKKQQMFPPQYRHATVMVSDDGSKFLEHAEKPRNILSLLIYD